MVETRGTSYVLFWLLGALMLLSSSALGQKYSVLYLGDLESVTAGVYSEAYCINATGQIVGVAQTSDGSHHAFLWQNRVMQDLGTLSGGSSTANSINDAGQIVGYDQPPGSGFSGSNVFLGFIWQKGVMSALGTLGGTDSIAAGISNAGVVVGNSQLPGGTVGSDYTRAFTWLNGVMTKIVDVPFGSGAVWANASGQVVGTYGISANAWHAFLWQNGVTTDLGDLGGGTSNATCINASGQVVGYSAVSSTINHGFLWQDGKLTDLGLLLPNSINNVGQIVGSIGSLAAMWQNGVTTDLNTLIPKITGLELNTAYSLNDMGQIVGTGSRLSDNGQAFLLTPNPFPNRQTVSVAHNTAKAIMLTGVDSSSPHQTLTFDIKSLPSHGALGVLNKLTGAVTYTPTSRFQGADAFTFTVSNAIGTSAPAPVTLNVAAGVPTANAQTDNVLHNTAKAITLKGTDPDNPASPLTYAIKLRSGRGTLSGFNSATGAVIYTPGLNVHGQDSFTFTVSNGSATSSPSTVTLNISAGVPAAHVQAVSVAYNSAKAIRLTGSDPESPSLPLTFAIKANPLHGILTGLNSATGAVLYSPRANASGLDIFTFTVSNGIYTSAPATVTINVAAGG